MKTKMILFTVIALCLMVGGTGCENEKLSDYAEGYIVGTFQCNVSNPVRNFCIILENNKDSIITHSLNEDIFNFTPGIIKSGHTGGGGPHFFPDTLRYKYKIGFHLRKMKKFEIEKCPIAYNMMDQPFDWQDWDWAILSDIRKLSK